MTTATTTLKSKPTPNLRYNLTLRPLEDPSDPTGVRRLRALLKFALRRLGLRCTAVHEVKAGDDAVQYGKLLLAAKVGELCPGEQGKRTDITSHMEGGKLPFHYNTLTDYRKLAKYQAEAGGIGD